MISDTSDPREISNILNNHFVTVGEKLTENMPKGADFEIHHNDPLTSFNLREIEYKEVYDMLKGISPSKACGVDGLTARLLKACGESIVAPLQYIFNLSIQTATFPTNWKIA